MENAETPKGRVFIPQEPMRQDAVSGKLVSMMNFNKARKYGEPIVICPTGPQALNTAPTLWNLKDKLRDFSDKDFLIAVGDPTLQAMAAVVAAEANRGKIKFLKWDRESSQYIQVHFNLHHKLGEGN